MLQKSIIMSTLLRNGKNKIHAYAMEDFLPALRQKQEVDKNLMISLYIKWKEEREKEAREVKGKNLFHLLQTFDTFLFLHCQTYTFNLPQSHFENFFGLLQYY